MLNRFFIFIFCLAFADAALIQKKRAANSGEINNINIAVLDLGLELLDGKVRGANQLTTPLNLYLLSSVMHEAAAEFTAEEIQSKVLKFKNHARFLESHELLTHLSKDFEMGTAVFLDQKHAKTLKAKFVKDTKQHFNTTVSTVDFKNQATVAIGAINDHFKEISKGKSGDLINPNSFMNVEAILTSIFYFDFEWHTKFGEYSETDRYDKLVFHSDAGKTIDVVRLMQENEKYIYYEGEDFEAFGVPFSFQYGRGGGSYQFIILKPTAKPDDPIENLIKMKKGLTGATIMNAIEKMTEKELMFSMPKFKINIPSKSVKPVFEKLGVTCAFDEHKADFTNMFGDGVRGIWVADIVANAFLEVDKEGARGGGSSAAVMISRGGPPYEQINVPYMYFIGLRTKYGSTYTFTTLMMGTMYNPKANEPEPEKPAYVTMTPRPAITADGEPDAVPRMQKWKNIAKTAVAFVFRIFLGRTIPQVAG